MFGQVILAQAIKLDGLVIGILVGFDRLEGIAAQRQQRWLGAINTLVELLEQALARLVLHVNGAHQRQEAVKLVAPISPSASSQYSAHLPRSFSPVHSTVNELLRLTLLEPAIIQAILAGQQPRCISLLWFQRNPLPTDWEGQREIVARFDA